MSEWKLEHRSRRSRSRWMNAMMPACAALLLVSATACRDGGPADEGEPPDPAAETALYVDAARGADANPGTREAPFATIATAIQRVGPGSEIRIAGGAYPQALTLRSGLRVIGGYDGATWQRSNVPTFVGAGSVAVTGSNVSDIVLDGLIIQSADVTEPGASSIAMLLNDVSGLTVRASRVMAGRGAAGRDGSPGANGGPGGRGAEGRTPVACFPGVTIPGGSGASSSFAGGGSGGYGSTVDGGNGARGGGADGGDIGQGGDRVGGIGKNGRDGGPGTTGSPGDDGRGGDAFGAWANGAYQPASGSNGTHGANGSGGGGGGGGAGAGAACGASGSGGGAGGSRGTAGTAGQGGGGSFGVIVSGTATLDGVEIVTAGGGNGGEGGRGGAGGAGGQGGSRRAGTSVIGSSGAGGLGGRGGNGGNGGGGGGGPSIGILELNGAQVTTTAVTFSLGEGGASGRGPGNAGQPGLRADRHAN